MPLLVRKYEYHMNAPINYPQGTLQDRHSSPMPLHDIRTEFDPVPFKTFTKRHIKKILSERAPHIDYMDYYVPSTVLP